jgi:hypothetical protein
MNGGPMTRCVFCDAPTPDTPDYRVEGRPYCVDCVFVAKQLSEERTPCPGCRGADLPCLVCHGRREVSALTAERLEGTTIEDVI